MLWSLLLASALGSAASHRSSAAMEALAPGDAHRWVQEQQSACTAVPLDVPDQGRFGDKFKGWKKDQFFDSIWTKQLTSPTVGGIVSHIELQCFEACMGILGCNYAQITQLSTVTCQFYSYCGLSKFGANNQFVLRRADESENVYSYKAKLFFWKKELKDKIKDIRSAEKYQDVNSAGKAKLKESLLEEYRELMTPRFEEEYQAWFKYVRRSTLKRTQTAGKITYNSSKKDLVEKRPVEAEELNAQIQAHRDLHAVTTALDVHGITRHHIVPPAVPQCNGTDGMQDTMLVERIWPAFAMFVNLSLDLEPNIQNTMRDKPLLQVEKLPEAIKMASKRSEEQWSWLQEYTGSSNPLKDIAYSKGVLDATLDCVTKLGVKTPEYVMGRNSLGQLRVYAVNFQATTLAGSRDWCKRKTPLKNYRAFSNGQSNFAPYPTFRTANDTDYLDGYNAALYTIHGWPATTTTTVTSTELQPVSTFTEAPPETSAAHAAVPTASTSAAAASSMPESPTSSTPQSPTTSSTVVPVATTAERSWAAPSREAVGRALALAAVGLAAALQ